MTTISSPRPPGAPGVTARNAETLLPVLRVIPKHCYERPTARGLRRVALGIGLYAGALALLAITHAWWLLLPLWVLAGLAVSGLFVLAHDCAHGALFEQKWLNRFVGRALMVPSLHVHEAWVLGHNRIHHGHTLREGMDFVWHPLTVEQYRALRPWQRARHRVEWSRFGAGAYYLREVWWNKMITFSPPERYRAAIRSDMRFVATWAGIATAGVGSIGWLTGGGPLGAVWLVAKLLVVPFLAFTWWIGFTVYVHHIDRDVKWWPRRSWTSFAGQVEGTTILHAPAVLNLFLHNIFVHVPHHVDVRIPCYALPEAAAAIVEAYPDDVTVGTLRLRDYVANVKACKLYDFELQRWSTYEAAVAPVSG